MILDLTIRLGDLLTALSIVAGGLFVLQALRIEQRDHSRRLLAIETELKKLVDVLVTLASQEVRIDSVEARLKRLEARVDQSRLSD